MSRWRGTIGDWVRCVAVANACLIRIWVDLLAYPVWPPNRDYDPPQIEHHASAIGLALALGTLLWLAFQVPAKAPRLCLAFGVICLFGKELFLAVSSLGTVPRALILQPIPFSIALLSVTALGYLLTRYPPRLGWVARKLTAALIPLTALTFAQSAWRATQIPAPTIRRFDNAVAGSKPPARRVVWIILDELDERVAFTQRRKGVDLPELDRYRREANFVALSARSPSSATLVSLPALMGLSGTDGANAAGSIFAKTRRAGLRAGIVGWAVPYCPIFRDWVETCAWWPMPQQSNSYGSGLAPVLGRMSRSLLESNQLSPFGQALAVRKFAQTVEEMTAAGAAAAARPDLDFVLLHLPPPHNPYVYNPATKKMDRPVVRFPNPEGYFNNLLLADSIFGRIRSAMEKGGVWEKSIVLVTADHGLRSAAPLGYAPVDRHVPFMVKSPVPIKLDPQAPLPTERTSELLLEWLGAPGS